MKSNQPLRLAELAAKLDCITEEDLALLADVKVETVATWRHRGDGPVFCKVGTRALYSVGAVVEWMCRRNKHLAKVQQ